MRGPTVKLSQSQHVFASGEELAGIMDALRWKVRGSCQS